MSDASPDSNPYAPPREIGTTPFDGREVNDRVWRKGSLIIVPAGSEMPCICIRTGKPGERFVKQTFAWHTPWSLLAIGAATILWAVLSWMSSSIVFFCISGLLLIGLADYWKTKRLVKPWLTLDHFYRRRQLLVFGYLAVPGGIGLIILADAIAASSFGEQSNPYPFSVTLVLGVTCLILGGILIRLHSKLLNSTLLTDQFILLSGANEPFLQHLEEFPYPLP